MPHVAIDASDNSALARACTGNQGLQHSKCYDKEVQGTVGFTGGGRSQERLLGGRDVFAET